MKQSLKKAIAKRNSSLYGWLIYLFLYLPIIIIVIFSFNTDERNIRLKEFTTSWYSVLTTDHSLLQSFGNTLIVTGMSVALSVIIGTLAAYGMWKYKFKGKGLLNAMLYMIIVIPEIVLGIAMLSIYTLVKLPMGFLTLILSHTTFCIPFVILTVRGTLYGFDKSLEEASMDLGVSPFKTFFKVTLPIIKPGVISGAFLAVTLSLDNFVITSFVNGPKTRTLPLKIMEEIRTGIKPDVNALVTIILVVVFVVITLSQTGVLEKIKKVKKNG